MNDIRARHRIQATCGLHTARERADYMPLCERITYRAPRGFGTADYMPPCGRIWNAEGGARRKNGLFTLFRLIFLVNITIIERSNDCARNFFAFRAGRGAGKDKTV